MAQEASSESMLKPHDALLRVPSSRSRSRPRSARHTSASSVLHLQMGPEALAYLEGDVSEETVELLHEFVHPHQALRHGADDTLIGEETGADEGALEEGSSSDGDGELADHEALQQRPWHKRPSPWWLLAMMPFSSIAMSACAAPRVEIYTKLACLQHKPEYSVGDDPPPAQEPIEIGVLGLPDYQHHWTVRYTGTHGQGEAVWVSFLEQSRSNDTNAAVSKMIAVLTSTMGILSCITTAWWGSLSDRYGRLLVLGISVMGLLLTDFNFILVSNFSGVLPGGYWFLVIGPFVEGSLGGLTSAIAAMHSYAADCTAPAARARIFSLALGLMFIGMAIGPSIGSLLVASTHEVLSVFYLATVVHLVYAVVVWTILPESLSPRAMQASRRRRKVEQEDEARRAVADGREARGRWLARLKGLFAFLTPLSIFVPVRAKSNNLPARKGMRDWSLALVATAYGFHTLVMGSYQFKFQYAAATFGWTSEELGYFLSLAGASRAIYLAAILPAIIKICMVWTKPAIQLPSDPSEPLHDIERPSDNTSVTPTPKAHDPTNAHSHHTPAFNLGLAQFSLAVEVVCYTLIPLAPTPTSFVVFSMLASCGGGFGPAVQSLALELFTGSGETETGRLFGALSVIQAMSSQIIGPALFSVTYVKTVSTYPRTIFFVSSAAVGCAFLFISFVKLPKTMVSEVAAADEVVNEA